MNDEAYKLAWRRSDFGPAAIEQSLAQISDRKWAVMECIRKVAATAEDTGTLLSYGLSKTADDRQYVEERLRLLQYKDRLQTFLGIHMGRFTPKEYKIFRECTLLKVAIRFAEGGKTGPLELLFKRHLYTLAPDVLSILDAIPETLSPHKYEQLLPDRTPPNALLPQRTQDWAESRDAVEGLPRKSSSGDEVSLYDSTEYVVRAFKGLRWPSEAEITSWYLDRARAIDRLSGQLENSILLLGTGLQKGFDGLRALSDDAQDLFKISFLPRFDLEGEQELSLSAWEQLDSYEKFKLMLKGVNEDTIVEVLVEVAVPFMRKHDQGGDLLARFLRELSTSGLFSLCAVVLQHACKEGYKGLIFQDEADLVEAAVSCIYATPQTDQWELMASVLSKLQDKDSVVEDIPGLRRGFVSAFRNRTLETAFPRPPSEAATRRKLLISDELQQKIVAAEGHVQAGKVLFQYQVPTPISFFLEQDMNGTKQKMRILLSKLSRRQPRMTEGEWTILWKDLQTLQEKAFTFLDREYILYEFCRGLLKAGRFSLAKIYLDDPLLGSDRVENLVLQTSREYFYSASSLESYDIERAQECLRLIPASKAAAAEADVIVAVTEKLPKLGVNLLPAQYRQIKNPMEVVKMAIYSRKGPVEDLLEVARLLGLSDTGDMAAIEEAVAREAAAYGDLELPQELCLGLARKEYGNIWDLCAAIGRGPDSRMLQVKARAELLAFALKHCDEESIGELLAAWKEFDLLDQCAQVAASAGMPAVHSTEVESFTALLARDVSADETGTLVEKLKAGQQAIHQVAQDCEESYGRDKKKVLAFACLQLPWLLKAHLDKSQGSVCTDATKLIMRGLGVQGLLPRDELLLQLSEQALRSSAAEGDNLSCGYLLNLSDSRHAAEFLAKELDKRNTHDYQRRLLKVGMLLSSLQEALVSAQGPEERRELLCSAMRERLPVKGETYVRPRRRAGVPSISSHFVCLPDPEEPEFWNQCKEEFMEKLRVFEQVMPLARLVSDLEIQRVIAGDMDYINSAIGSVISTLTLSTVSSVEQLAGMLDILQSVLPGSSLEVLFTAFVRGTIESFNCEYCEGLTSSPEESSSGLSHLRFMEEKYGICTKYFRLVSPSELGSIIQTIFRRSYSLGKKHDEDGAAVLAYVVKFWVQATGDIFSPEDTEPCNALLSLIEDGLVGPSQGWDVVSEVSVNSGNSVVPSRVILRCMALAGCSYEAVTKFVKCLPRPESEQIVEVYMDALLVSIDHLLATSEFQLMKNVIFSAGFQDREQPTLGEAETKLREDVQQAVWSRLCALEVPSGTRLSMLEILGGIGKFFEPSQRKTELVALKSTEIVSREFGGNDVQIATETLSSLESASSCFASLADRTSSNSQAVTLVTLLREWDDIFGLEKEEKIDKEEDEKDEEEDWGDGWQQFDEEVHLPSLDNLHSCWKTAFAKLLQYDGLDVVLRVLDELNESRLLLKEDEAEELIEQLDVASALKLALLLPYETLRSTSLRKMEDLTVDQKAVTIDPGTLVLLLSAGLVPSLAGDSKSAGFFAAVCRCAEKLARDHEVGSWLLFPYLVAELTRGSHFGTAGSLVMQYMRVPFSFSTWNVSHFALRRYLEAQRGNCKKSDGDGAEKWRDDSRLSYLSQTLIRLVANFEMAVTQGLNSIK